VTTFPTHASYEEHTPETVLEHVIAPVAAKVMRLATAARGMQHGRVQAYLLYLVLGLAGLAVVALLGGSQ